MFTKFKKTIVISGLLILTFNAKSQSLQDSIPVVISLADDSQLNINKVKNQLQSLSNMSYVGFCNNHKVFLMYIDPQFHGAKTFFLSNLIKSTGLYDLTLKEGSVADIIGFCEFKDSAEHDKIKLQLAK